MIETGLRQSDQIVSDLESEVQPSNFLLAVEATLPEEHALTFRKLLKNGFFASSPLGDWDPEKIWAVLHTGSGLEWAIGTLLIMRVATFFAIKDWNRSTRYIFSMNTFFSASIAALVGTIRWASLNQNEAQNLMNKADAIVRQLTIIIHNALAALQ